MVFLREMWADWLGIRPGPRNLRICRAQSRRAISNQWINRLLSVFLIVAWGAIPSRAQNDVALQASELMRTGKFHDAELLWRQLEQQHPKDPVIHANLGVALAQQGKLESATAEYHKSLALKPDQPDVELNMGIAEFKQGHFSAAIPAFELVLEAKPEDRRGTVLLGMSYFGLRQYDKASQYFADCTPRRSFQSRTSHGSGAKLPLELPG